MVAANGELPRPTRDALVVWDATSGAPCQPRHAHAGRQESAGRSGGIRSPHPVSRSRTQGGVRRFGVQCGRDDKFVQK